MFFQIVILCFDLPAPENGSVIYNSGIISRRPIGSIGSYSCNTGYLLVGNVDRTCQSDGSWNGSRSICEGKQSDSIMYICILRIDLYSVQWLAVRCSRTPSMEESKF